MTQHSTTTYTNMKEYLVTLHRIEDNEDFYNDMETPGGPLYIPNRAVELVSRRPISRTTHYMLTEEEAELLKQDSRVMDVRLNDTDLGIKILPLGGFDPNLRQISSAWDASNTVSADMLNWGLVRCTRPRSNVTLQWDVWGYLADRSVYANAEIGFRYFAIDNRNYYTKNATGDSWTDEGDWDTSYASWGNYFSTGIWPTATTATVDLNFYGANVDVVVVDAASVQVGHPEFAVNPDGTGGTRCVQYNWYQHNPAVKGTAVGNYAYNVFDSHAIHVTGTVAGNTQGWAKRATIYNISYNEGAYVIDYIREFHKNKPINPATGVKNPTIVNNSWGKFYGKFTKDKITSVNYRGNVYSAPFTDKQLFEFGLLPSNLYDSIGNFQDTALDQDLIDANSEGIIFVGAAGNSKFLIDRPDGPDWNNYAVISANASHDGHVTGGTYYYNRGQVPGNYSSLYKLCIGALGDFPWDSKASFSNCGPGVDLYAPGYNIMSAYLNDTNINPAVPDNRNASYYLQKNQGTSMASPQVAGIIACLAERYPHWTQKEFKDYLFQYAEYGTIKDGARGWTLATNTAVATSNYNIQGSGNRVAKFAPRGLRYEGNLSITEISNEFLDANVTNKSLSDYFGGDSGIYGPFPGGDSMYTVPGNYSWLCPANVYSVSIVLVGGGGSGGTGVSGDANVSGAGGGGGALGWINNISVTPGQTYSLRVGTGGAALAAIGQYGNNGQDSYIIINSVTYSAGPGSGGPGGTWLVGQPEGGPGGVSTNCQGGGAGGAGGFGTITTRRAGGGGGAGGYTGNGGGGGYLTATETFVGGAGQGGAGGGGTYSSVGGIATRGGSVGIFGQLADGALNANGSVFATQTNVGAGGAGGVTTSGAGMGGAVRIMWPGAHRNFPVTQVDNRTTIYPPRKFSDYYSADYKLTKIITANLASGFNWSSNTTNYTIFPTSHRLATNTKKIVVLPNVIIGNTATSGNAFLVSGNWEGDVVIDNRGVIIAGGGDPSETASIKNGGHGIGIAKANATSNVKVINYGFIAGGGAAGGTGGQGGEGEWQFLTYSNTYSGTANIIRWRGYRKDNGLDYPGYDVWAWNAAYTKTTGTLTRYTPTAGSLEIQQAENSGYWYSYSLAQDHWYYDSLEPNLRVRIAAIDAGGNSRYRPYYAGQVLYYHYVGPVNTRLGVTMTKATITALGFAGTRYNLTAFDRPYLTTSARSHIATTWGTNSTVNTVTPSEDGKIFTVTVSSGTGIGTDADPYKDFHYTRVSTTSSWRTTGYSHRPGTAQWPKNMWTGGIASTAGGQDPRDGVSQTFYANVLNGTASVVTRFIDSSNTSSLCIYNVPATVSYTYTTLDLFYYPTYNIYGALGHPWYYLHYNDTNGYDGGVLFTDTSGGLTYGGGFSSGLTTNVVISSVTTNYRKTARRAGGAGGFGRGYLQGITYGSAGSAAFENAGEGGYGGPGGDYGEDGLVGNVGFFGSIANSNVVGANIFPLNGNVGGIGGNVIYGDYVYLVNYGNVYGRYNDGKYNDGLENPSGDGNNRPRYRAGI